MPIHYVCPYTPTPAAEHRGHEARGAATVYRTADGKGKSCSFAPVQSLIDHNAVILKQDWENLTWDNVIKCEAGLGAILVFTLLYFGFMPCACAMDRCRLILVFAFLNIS